MRVKDTKLLLQIYRSYNHEKKMPNGFILGNKHIYRSVLVGVYCIPIPVISTQRKNKKKNSVTLTLASMVVILLLLTLAEGSMCAIMIGLSPSSSVRPSVCSSVRPFVRPSVVRPSVNFSFKQNLLLNHWS